MAIYRRSSEAAERAAERRRREDSAARLIKEVPRLVSLSLEIEERRPTATSGTRHIRRIVVATAPALFIVPCSDQACQDGGYDLTRAIMQRLREGATRFTDEQPCNGYVANGHCPNVLHYVASAEYRDE